MAKLTKRGLKNPLSIIHAFEKGMTIHDINEAFTALFVKGEIKNADEFAEMLMSVEVAYADYYN